MDRVISKARIFHFEDIGLVSVITIEIVKVELDLRVLLY